MGAVFAILMISTIFLPVLTAQAQINDGANSQNLQILQASSFPMLASVGDITIDHSSALQPEVGPMGTASDVKSDYQSDEILTYVVRKGDTLGTIAKMFNISQNTIVWSNDLVKGQALKEGDTLVILPVSGVEYIIKKGDTLRGIAKKFNADIDDISTFNGVTTETVLAVGDEIIIPDGEMVTPATVSSHPSKPAPNYSGPSYVGYYMRPVSGGRRTQGIHGHNGVDLGGLPVGSPIMAAADGTVILSRMGGYNGGYGNYVVLSHANGTQTLYAHMIRTNVAAGVKVKQGDIIGFLGSTGRSTGPHLHFEIRGAKNPF
jgi:murein DD-endopeptidase MepM/ murein hydrolase activator NlpD